MLFEEKEGPSECFMEKLLFFFGELRQNVPRYILWFP